MSTESDMTPTELAASDNCFAYRIEEPDGEVVYDLMINNITINFFQEEWDDFLAMARQLIDVVDHEKKTTRK